MLFSVATSSETSPHVIKLVIIAFERYLEFASMLMYGSWVIYHIGMINEDQLEVCEDEKGSCESGKADGVAGEVDVGEGGRVGHLPHLRVSTMMMMVMVMMMMMMMMMLVLLVNNLLTLLRQLERDAGVVVGTSRPSRSGQARKVGKL